MFLDEIGDMPLLLQTRLLRVLEEQEVIPLGAETGVAVELRVICASNRDLRELIAAGEFREDLYYRLNGIMLELPSLAARTDKDVLIRRFLAEERAHDGRGLDRRGSARVPHRAHLARQHPGTAQRDS